MIPWTNTFLNYKIIKLGTQSYNKNQFGHHLRSQFALASGNLFHFFLSLFLLCYSNFES